MGGKSRPHRDSIPDCPAHSLVAIPTELPDAHTLTHARARAHTHTHTHIYIYIYIYNFLKVFDKSLFILQLVRVVALVKQ